MERFLTDRI